MAAFHGKQGKVTFAGGAVSNVLSWSVEVTADVAESSVMSSVAVSASTHWKEYLAGFFDWTATIECDLDNSGLDPDLDVDFIDDDGVEVILYQGTNPMGARKYTGNGIVTGISPSVDLNDIIKVTYTVQGSGALVEAAVPV
ncbi:hypothetical protein LCGC14_0421490 [marine sediment metagenome]|uniref:Uncharacterized protein n=1 Tax=marine sediment metagenome TaxID=412755 RepID=A0A0F9T8W2_9ZZZZ